MVKDQHIMGPNGPIDINLQVVYEAVKGAGFDDVTDTVRLIRNAYNARLAALRGV